MRCARCSVPFLVVGGLLVTLVACTTKKATLCTESLEPVASQTTFAPRSAPALRVDGRVFGQIVGCEIKTGSSLGMQPGDMTIYVIEFRVDRSEHDRVSPGQTLTLYSKLSVDESLSNAPGWVQVATYSTRPAWLIGYE